MGNYRIKNGIYKMFPQTCFIVSTSIYFLIKIEKYENTAFIKAA